MRPNRPPLSLEQRQQRDSALGTSSYRTGYDPRGPNRSNTHSLEQRQQRDGALGTSRHDPHGPSRSSASYADDRARQQVMYTPPSTQASVYHNQRGGQNNADHPFFAPQQPPQQEPPTVFDRDPGQVVIKQKMRPNRPPLSLEQRQQRDSALGTSSYRTGYDPRGPNRSNTHSLEQRQQRDGALGTSRHDPHGPSRSSASYADDRARQQVMYTPPSTQASVYHNQRGGQNNADHPFFAPQQPPQQEPPTVFDRDPGQVVIKQKMRPNRPPLSLEQRQQRDSALGTSSYRTGYDPCGPNRSNTHSLEQRQQRDGALGTSRHDPHGPSRSSASYADDRARQQVMYTPPSTQASVYHNQRGGQNNADHPFFAPQQPPQQEPPTVFDRDPGQVVIKQKDGPSYTRNRSRSPSPAMSGGFEQGNASLPRRRVVQQYEYESDLVHCPAVPSEGMLFRARFLGSTKLMAEVSVSKAARISQAKQAVCNVKDSEGEVDLSVDVDLFISMEKVLALNTDLQIISDHEVLQVSGALKEEAHENEVLKYINDFFVFESEEACRMGQAMRLFLESKCGTADEQRVIMAGKLVMLVDLDKTILHTTSRPLGSDMEAQDDVFQYVLRGTQFATKVRPYARTFLEKMNEKYDMHVVTLADSEYAKIVLKVIDPFKKYFQRVVTRQDMTIPHNKSAIVKTFFPGVDRLIAIVDDRADVWQYSEALVQVKPYCKFKEVGDINAAACGHANEPVADLAVNDDDHVLEHVERVLTDVHQAFYKHYDTKGEIKDLKLIISYLKSQVLRGLHIVLSGVVPLGIKDPRQSVVYHLCVQFGAKVMESVTPETTHVIAAKWGTQKVRQAAKMGKLVVTPAWIYACVEMWLKADEKDFELTKDTIVPESGHESGRHLIKELSDLPIVGKGDMKNMCDEPPLHHAHPSQSQQPYANVANLPPTSMSTAMIPQQSSRAQLFTPGVERPTHYAGPPPHLAGPFSATSSESLVPPGTIVPPPWLGPTGLLQGPIPGQQQIIQRPIRPGNYKLNLNAAQFAVPGGPVPMDPGMYNRAANVEDKWMEYTSRRDQEKMRQRGADKDRDREKRRHRIRSRSSSASESSSESSGYDREREKRRRREEGKERGRDKERREKRERITDGRSKHDDKRHEREEKRVVVRERDAKRKSGDDRRRRGHEARERIPGSRTEKRRRSDKEEIAVEEEIADEQRPDSREDDEDLIDAQLREVEEGRSKEAARKLVDMMNPVIERKKLRIERLLSTHLKCIRSLIHVDTSSKSRVAVEHVFRCLSKIDGSLCAEETCALLEVLCESSPSHFTMTSVVGKKYLQQDTDTDYDLIVADLKQLRTALG